MNTYKALVVDFDNTLADVHTYRITSQVKQAIKQLIQKGYLFSIVTGKPFAGHIEEVCKELNLQTPQIVHGGAEIIDPQTQEILWAKYIDDVEVKEIIAHLLREKIIFCVEKGRNVYTSNGEIVSFYGDLINFKHVDSLRIRDIPKIVIPSSMNKFTESNVDILIEEMKGRYKDIHTIKGKFRDYYGFDITHLGATKQTAMFEYMKLLRLEKEKVVGVGMDITIIRY